MPPHDFLDLQLQNVQPGEDNIESFPIYEDHQLAFLDQDTSIGREISRCIVQADFDDDCATDEDMHENATRVLEKELKRGITSYLSAKNEDKIKSFINNFDAINRFKKPIWQDDE